MPGAESLNVTAPTDREIVITRAFDAPRDHVWKAMTDPGLIGRWCAGPPGWEMTVCENKPAVGGAFRNEWRGAEGEARSSRRDASCAPPRLRSAATAGRVSSPRRSGVLRWAEQRASNSRWSSRPGKRAMRPSPPAWSGVSPPATTGSGRSSPKARGGARLDHRAERCGISRARAQRNAARKDGRR